MSWITRMFVTGATEEEDLETFMMLLWTIYQ